VRRRGSAPNGASVSVAIKERIGDREGWLESQISLGAVAYTQGDGPRAVRRYGVARRLARRMGIPHAEARAALGQARALMRDALPRRSSSPRPARLAGALLERGRALAAAHDLAEEALLAALLTAEGHLSRGEVPAARTAAEEVVRQAAAARRRREDALARRVLGLCCLAGGELGSAEGHLRAALQALSEIGAAVEIARTRVALARALSALGEGGSPQEAGALLAEARTQFAAHGAAWDLTYCEALTG
jgi:hypothetical protein